MSQSSDIEWTDATWNPVRGCNRISPGCDHCYAEKFAERWRGIPGHPYEQGFDLRLVPKSLGDPIRWPQPRMIFVNSMSDLFHEEVPYQYIRAVFEVMALANWHTYQILTKRAYRMRQVTNRLPKRLTSSPHIWLGISVEDRRHGLPRIDEIRGTRAEVRFISFEPLLEDLGEIDLGGIDWVIVGGESGPGARTLQANWVRSIRDECQKANVPFFFKQWGGVRKKRAGRILDGRVHNMWPDTARLPRPSHQERERIASKIKRMQLSFAVELTPVYAGQGHV